MACTETLNSGRHFVSRQSISFNKKREFMKTLFDIQPVNPAKPEPPFPGKRCKDCEYCRNLNSYSGRYRYCIITPSNRTTYGVKAIKRMNDACINFKEKGKEI
jgi:hypothetical protein